MNTEDTLNSGPLPADLPTSVDSATDASKDESPLEPASGGAFLEQLVSAQADAAQWREQCLRASAEVENVRRRAQEEMQKSQKYAIEAFAQDLLAVKDSLELALSAEVLTVENLRVGVDATLQQLSAVFQRHLLLEIDPYGFKFDPNQHQAITTVSGSSLEPALPPDHVGKVLQKGYLINDRVLRPALVSVTK